MKKLPASIAALAIAASGLLSANSVQAAPQTTLTIGSIGSVKSLQARDLQLSSWSPLVQAVYDPLIFVKPDNSLAPGLALSWKYDELLTTLTLALRPKIVFTNGERFNAAAVCANLTGFSKGDSQEANTLASMETCKPVGALKVVITLKDVDPGFISLLGGIAGHMQAPKTIGTDAAKTNSIGTGPYILDTAKSVTNSVYYYKSNPKYWNKPVRKFDNLVVKIITDTTAMVNALRTGQVDCGLVATATAVPSLTDAGLKVLWQSGSSNGLYLVDIDGSMGTPLKDIRVRQAINYALDRKALVHLISADAATPTDQIFASYHKAYDPALENRYPYDPAKAKELLTAAGYPNGFTLKMPTITFFDRGVASNAMKAMLSAVGIVLDYTNYDSKPLAYTPDLMKPMYPLFWTGLTRPVNDWNFIQWQLSRTAVWNIGKFGTATSDALIAKVQASTGAAQVKYLKQLNAYVTEQAWFAPFMASALATVYNPKKVKVLGQPGDTVPHLPFGILPVKK